MKSQVHIRRATESDFAVIQAVAHATWPVTFGEILSPAQIAYMLEMMYSTASLHTQTNEKQHVFQLAEVAGVAHGYVSHQLDHPAHGTTKIHKIYVLPTAQGMGIGAALIAKVAEIARDAQQCALTLNVNKYNKAQAFYERLGFAVAGYENIDIGNGFLMEDAIMVKPLD